MPEIESLIECADRILSSELTDPDLVELIVTYAGLFEAWEKQLPLAELAKQPEMVGTLQEVQRKHTQVIEKAEGVKSGVAEALRSLKHRGRGIMAYADPYPRRISTMRTRKG